MCIESGALEIAYHCYHGLLLTAASSGYSGDAPEYERILSRYYCERKKKGLNHGVVLNGLCIA